MEDTDLLNDRYIILKKKNSGNSSIVYKVKDSNSKSEEIYGAKILKKQEKDELTKTYEIFFDNEIKFLKELKKKNNPYIINIIENGEGVVKRLNKPPSKHKYIILDYASKGNLFEYICYTNLSLDEDYCRLIFDKIFKGIEECHKSNICNRDIKLENILLDKNYNPKICDFGFAEYNSDNLKDQVGSKNLFDPQIFNNSGYNGLKTDIFNLGLALFTAVTGKYFINTLDKKNDIRLFFKNKEKLLWEKYEKESNKTFSKEIKDLIKSMLSYEQKKRPTIEQVLESPWFDKLRIASNEEIVNLQEKMKNELKNRRSLIKENKILKAKVNGSYNNDSLTPIGNRSGEENVESIFDSESIPKTIKKESVLNDFIKIKGKLKYAKFMDHFYHSIKKKFEDNCGYNEDTCKFKFNIIFDIDIDDLFKEFKSLDKEINGLDNNNEDNKKEEESEEESEEDKNKENNKIVLNIQVKIFKTKNDDYLLRFKKCSGSLDDYYNNLKIIIPLAKSILNKFNFELENKL